ncbi:MAG: CHAT domain-containing tetratricopeptide repeat protein [Acidobacteriota bacterium]
MPEPKRSYPRTLGRLWTTLAMVWFLGSNASLSAPIDPRGQRLEPGQPVERTTASGDVHRYQVTVTASQTLRLVVNQHGVDVALEVDDPRGEPLITVDSPGGRHVPEWLLLEGLEPGIYSIDVRAPARGSYRIEVEEVSPAKLEPRWLAAQRALREGGELFAQGTPGAWRRAIPIYETALAYPQSTEDRRQEAWLFYSLGVLHSKVNEVEPALQRFHQALILWRDLGERQGEADALHKIGFCHHLRHEYDKAFSFSRQALDMRRSLGDLPGQAETASVIGVIEHYRSKPRQALVSYEQALGFARQAGDPGMEAAMLNSIGGVSEVLGEWRQALDFFRRAREIHRAVGERQWEARTLNNMGAIYRKLGEYQKALDHYHQALAIRRSIGDHRGEATSLNSLGRAYLNLGEPEQALVYFRRALPLRRESADRRGEAATLHNLGNAWSRLDDHRKALGFYLQALAIRQAIGNRRGEATTLDQIGATHAALGETRQALASLSQALELRQAIGDPSREAMTLRSLAEIQLTLDQPAKAEAQARAALGLQRGVDDRVGEAQTLAVLARVARQVGDLTAARTHLESSLEIIETLRTRVESPDLRATFFARKREAYLEYIDLLMALHRDDPSQGLHIAALEATERARARSLLDLLSEAGAEVEREIARPREAVEIRRLLDPGTLLLQYSLGAERSFLWAVTTASVTSFELPPRATLESAARELHRSWSTLDLLGQGDEQRAAGELSRLLLQPVAHQVRRSDRLVIVADGALHYLPFAALPLGDATGPPLLAELEIVALPSASVLAIQRQTPRRAAPDSFAVLADPVFDSADPRVTLKPVPAPASDAPERTRSATVSAREQSFPRLAASRREAKAIVDLAAGRRVFEAVDFAANRAVVTSGRLRDFRLIHFATHGVLDSSEPRRSGLVLSLVDEDGKPADGFLRLPEIYALELQADVVVLSGCQTALGKEIRGEGLVGLTRGFMYAGAERVLASLWKVQDKATAELMTRFYRFLLQDGLSPAAALRAAQRSILSETDWQDPYYWAAFVLQGDWR